MYGPDTLPPFLGSETTNIQGNSPLEYILSLFPKNIVENIVYQTSIYAIQNKLNFGLTKVELSKFVDINLIMSYIKYTGLCLYWSSEEGLQMDLIANSTYSLDKNDTDKLRKIRSFLDRLKENFLAAAELEEYQSIGEQIVPLKSRLAEVTGYINRFEVYQGTSRDRAVISNFGACADVVLRLSSDLVLENHKLFFDNLFCSIPLRKELKLRDICSTETLGLNRLQNAKSSLKLDKDMKRD
ncbi:hypothetical protein ILUMI_04615 [Ignelater luminosus]|uniref:PiggyBac transposable element-derived protein domain-containing protein n=1 Tax=Ignelater luminosus TaxID=2038154 RepID=A0A8K0D9C1_IGNLU|nr:hypothetical protein ILUMI_04615 [Ignelater luminosus]